MGKLKNAGEWLWGLAIAPLTMLGLTVYSLFLSLLAAPLFAIYMVFVGAVLLSLFGLWWSLTSLFPVLEGYGELALILALPLSLVLLPWIADRKKRSSTLWRWLWTRE